MDYFRHPAIARIAPFALYIAFLPLGQLLTRAYPSADLRWLYGAQVGVTALAVAICWRHYGELRIRAAIRMGDGVLAVAAGLLVFVLWVNLDQPVFLLGEMGQGYDPRNEAGQIIPVLALVRVLGAALIVPLMEELFWRSFLTRWIDRPGFLELPPQRISFKGLVLSSILFGIEHTLWFAGLLAGLIYGLLYRKCGNLWVPILSHAVTNFALALWVLRTGNWQFW